MNDVPPVVRMILGAVVASIVGFFLRCWFRPLPQPNGKPLPEAGMFRVVAGVGLLMAVVGLIALGLGVAALALTLLVFNGPMNT